MKKYIYIVSTILVFSSSLGASPLNGEIFTEGGGSTSVKIALNELTKNKHSVTFEKPENEKVYIKIYGKTGVLLNKRKVGKAKDAIITYDLNDLPIGTYKIVVTDHNGQTIFENVLSVK